MKTSSLKKVRKSITECRPQPKPANWTFRFKIERSRSHVDVSANGLYPQLSTTRRFHRRRYERPWSMRSTESRSPFRCMCASVGVCLCEFISIYMSRTTIVFMFRFLLFSFIGCCQHIIIPTHTRTRCTEAHVKSSLWAHRRHNSVTAKPYTEQIWYRTIATTTIESQILTHRRFHCCRHLSNIGRWLFFLLAASFRTKSALFECVCVCERSAMQMSLWTERVPFRLLYREFGLAFRFSPCGRTKNVIHSLFLMHWK